MTAAPPKRTDLGLPDTTQFDKSLNKNGPADYMTYGLAGLVSTFGVMDYMKTGNMPYMAMHLAFGGALAYGGYKTSKDPHDYMTTLLASSALAAFKGKKFYDTGRAVPFGLVAALAGANAIRYGARYMGYGQHGQH